MSLPIIAIVLVYSIIVFVRPFFGIILFILFLQIENSSSLFINTPISFIVPFAAQANKYLIIILALKSLQLLINRQPVNHLSNDKHIRFFLILIAFFSIWSFCSFLWADYDFTSIVSQELRRLMNFIIMIYVIYLNINNRNQLIIVMVMGLVLSFIKFTMNSVLYFVYGKSLLLSGGVGLVIFAVLYLFRAKNLSYKITGILFTISVFAANILTSSRRSFLALGIAILITVFSHFSKKMFYTVIMLFFTFYMSINLLPTDYFYYRLNQARSAMRSFDSGWSGRENIWGYAWEAGLAKPIIGHGYGSNTEVIREYGHREFGIRTHNSYLKVWVELGFVGLVSLISMFITHTIILYDQIKRIRLFKDNLLYSLVFARFASWIGTFITAFFGYSAYLHKSMWLTFCFTLITNKIINTYPVQKLITVKQ